jgi:hypothetical protein
MFLLDTMVVSEPTKKRASPKVLSWLSGQQAADLFISAVTLGEIIYGIDRLPPGPQRQRLTTWREQLFLAPDALAVLPIDAAVTTAWGQLRAQLRHTAPVVDSLVAATALAHRLTVVTRNEKDFASMGAPVFNPWA